MTSSLLLAFLAAGAWAAPPSESYTLEEALHKVARNSPEVQLAFATELFWSPTNRTVKLPHDVAKKIINGPADVDKLLVFDWAQIAKQRPQWTERWNKEMR